MALPDQVRKIIGAAGLRSSRLTLGDREIDHQHIESRSDDVLPDFQYLGRKPTGSGAPD